MASIAIRGLLIERDPILRVFHAAVLIFDVHARKTVRELFPKALRVLLFLRPPL
jgi:hypothetical protein